MGETISPVVRDEAVSFDRGPRPIHWPTALTAASAMAVVLTLVSGGYGYHRDELYFRMLPPAPGYVDQPPLTPFLASLATRIADEVWALRLPATLAAAVSVIAITGIAAVLGGGRLAQRLAAWGYAFAAAPLMLGHLLLTSTIDLLLWPAVVLAALKAGRHDPRWWLAAGALGGLATYNRWLVAVLAAGLVVGLAIAGPRSALRVRWLWAGAALAGVVALPNLAYQARNDWPQLAMGDALAAHSGGEVRSEMWLILVVLLGPPLVPIVLAGLVALVRDPRWRDARWLAVAFVGLVAFTWWAAAQVHYPMGLLPVMYAAGCVVVARWLADRAAWRRVVVALMGVNAAISLVIALPLIPVGSVGDSPVPDLNPLVGDTVGWPLYVAQIAEAHRSLPAGTPVITANYGEAGAVARHGPPLGLAPPLSGQNDLWHRGRPADGTTTVLLVGGQLEQVRDRFASCEVVARLDNGVDVDNEEQGQPVAVCRGPREPWSTLWGQFQHLD